MSSLTLPPPASSYQRQVHYSFNSRVMLAAMLILVIVVLFVLGLHIYAKWFWRPRNAASIERNGILRWRPRQHSLADSASVDAETQFPTIWVGLDSATINSLPTFIYQANATEPLLECAVCLSEFQAYEKGRLLPDCKHSFHIGCIDRWFRSQSTCPLCRSPVSPWTPQQHTQNTSSQSIESTATQGFFLELPSTPDQPTEQTTFQSPLHDASLMPTTDNLRAQSVPITPPLQGNSRIQLQEQHQEGLAKDGKLAWKLSKFQPDLESCNVDGTSGSSSTGSTSAEIRGQFTESGASIARCQSLGVSRYQSEDTEAGSLQQIKSRSFRMSIKRLLSRELSRGSWGKVFPSAAGDAEDQEEQSSVSRSSPV